MAKFTQTQKQHLTIFIGLMAMDFVITTIGYLFYDGFVEANPVFSQFYYEPLKFILAIAAAKSVYIIFILFVVFLANRGKDYIFGNRVCAVCSSIMAIAMGVLFVANVVIM